MVDIVTLTLTHVGLSLLGLGTGLVVVGGLISGVALDGWIGVFLVTTVLTNITGFGFPTVTLLPSHYVAVLSLLILPVAIAAFYWKHLAGPWRNVFVVTVVLALYFNVFVLIAQLFRRVPGLIAAAPTQNSPVFLVTQLLALILFLWVGRAALKGFREKPVVRR
jgi:hypothetical protein